MQTNILLYSKSGYFPSNIHITLSFFAEEQNPGTVNADLVSNIWRNLCKLESFWHTNY